MTTIAAVETEGQMTPGELVQRFIADMTYDAHSAKIRFLRSEAQRELVRRGKLALPAIIEHLEANPCPNQTLDPWWCNIIHQIERRVKNQIPAPESLEDIGGWVTWAKGMVA